MAQQLGFMEAAMPMVEPPAPPKYDFPATASFVRQKVTVLPVEQVSIPVEVIDPDEYHRIQQRKHRRCLHCGDSFLSQHAGVRICSPCKESPIWGTPNDFTVSAAF